MKMMILVLVCALLVAAALAANAEWKQDRIIVTFWCPPPATDENLAAVKADHYNLTWTSADGMDVAHRHGLKAMLWDYTINPAALDDPAKKAKMDALIDRVKNHPAMEAYYIVDEPGIREFEALGKLATYIRERDPNHLVYINLYPTYANDAQLGVDGKDLPKEVTGIPMNFEGVGTDDHTVIAYQEYLKRFVDTIKPELISYDHYHFLPNKDGEQYFLNLGLIREAALQAKVPFLNIIQAARWPGVWRDVNAREMRWLVYTTLAYGGKGISYFTYWHKGGLYHEGKRQPLADDVAVLNEEIESLSPVLMELDSLGVYHTAPLPYGAQPVPTKETSPLVSAGSSPASPLFRGGPRGGLPLAITGGEFVLGVFGKAGKPSAFMVVNRSYTKSAAATITLPAGTQSVREYNRKARAWRTYTKPGPNNTITVSLKPGDGRLFEF